MTSATEAIYEAALETVRRGGSAALVTVVDASGSAPRHPGAKMLLRADGRTVGTVGGGPVEAWVLREAKEALAQGVSRLLRRSAEQDADVCGGEMAFFVDVLVASPTLLIIGAGHIGQALASMGSWLGYRVAVLDERPELVDAERLPDADICLPGSVDEQLREFPLTERTYVAIVTPHHSPDEIVLSILSERRVAYVGLLGGHRRTRATFRRAREAGVPDAFLEEVRTPVGLDIHAETPKEIAISILAEITAVRRQKGEVERSAPLASEA
ncbi:MAG: XdhC family protein [Chloroflexota bacterium]